MAIVMAAVTMVGATPLDSGWLAIKNAKYDTHQIHSGDIPVSLGLSLSLCVMTIDEH